MLYVFTYMGVFDFYWATQYIHVYFPFIGLHINESQIRESLFVAINIVYLQLQAN